jgi:hypothetical protein
LLKKIKWSLFFWLLVFVGLLASCKHLVVNLDVAAEMDYFLLFLGGFGIWMFYVSMDGLDGFNFGSMPSRASTPIPLLFILAFLSAFAGVILWLVGGEPLIQFPQEFSLSLADWVPTIFCVYIAGIAGQIVILGILSRRIVPEGVAIVEEDLLLRPGEKYSRCPFLRYNLVIIKEKMSVTLSGFAFRCCDGQFRADCETSVVLGISEMRPEGFFYWKNFQDILDEQLKKFMDGSIVQLIQRETLRQIIERDKKGATEPSPLGNIDVCGLWIPVYWDGRMTLSSKIEAL